jgi:acetyl-CoA/propionyl-CoA carboxylase biotin carboxyl carrier protein
VRVDTGVESGSVISGAFDSLLAKIIVTGSDRQQSIERARRVLDETVVEGMATVLPFHRAVVRDPAFAPADPDQTFTIHNRWIETEWNNTVEPWTGTGTGAADAVEAPREKVTVEVGGKRLEVVLPEGFGAGGGGGKAAGPKRAAPKRGTASAGSAPSGDSLVAPMQGTIVKVAASNGDTVAAGDLIIVLEAMKMENPVTAHKAGVVKGLAAAVGEVVPSGTVLATIADAEG